MNKKISYLVFIFIIILYYIFKDKIIINIHNISNNINLLFNLNLPEHLTMYVYPIISFSTLISEDITSIVTGILISQGKISASLGIFACITGIFIGDILLYIVGYYFGKKIMTLPFLKKKISSTMIENQMKRFEKKGLMIVFISRFFPGTRLITYLSAGILRVSFIKFTLYFLLAVCIWTPLLVGLSALLGEKIHPYFKSYQDNSVWLFLTLILSFIFIKQVYILCINHEKRVLLIATLTRLTRFEFWSRTVVYLPIFIYVLVYSLINRSLLLGTVVNPGIECSGLIGESKSTMLHTLERSAANIPPFICISPSLKESQTKKHINDFLEEKKLNFPLIIKPDIGERGHDVYIIKTKTELLTRLKQSKEPTIIQAFAPGLEFGLFYCKLPNAKGQVTSLAEKIPTIIYGDGTSTLKELILSDPRAVLMAKFFFKEHKKHLNTIPKKDEKIKLNAIGTHSKGAIFINANDHITTMLTEKIRAISVDYEGFYYGRFDIKVPTLQDLKKGENIQILELNGLSGEPAHIYHPKNSIINAYRDLLHHWIMALHIAKHNLKKGHRPISLLTFLSHLKHLR